jgi:hypothetical protein
MNNRQFYAKLDEYNLSELRRYIITLCEVTFRREFNAEIANATFVKAADRDPVEFKSLRQKILYNELVTTRTLAQNQEFDEIDELSACVMSIEEILKNMGRSENDIDTLLQSFLV